MNDKKLASEIREALLNQQTLIKKAGADRAEALVKAAALEEEVKVLRDVLDLVSKGVIDPSDAISKVAEFLQDPQQLEVLKQAYMLGFEDVPRIGVPRDDEKPSSGLDPITEVLIELEPRLRNK